MTTKGARRVMMTLSKNDIKKLPKKLQIKLLKFGFKKLDYAVSNEPYFHEDYPEDCALWRDIMEALEDE